MQIKSLWALESSELRVSNLARTSTVVLGLLMLSQIFDLSSKISVSCQAHKKVYAAGQY